MSDNDLGRVASPPGSRPSGQAPSGLDASRFDPSRCAVAGLNLPLFSVLWALSILEADERHLVLPWWGYALLGAVLAVASWNFRVPASRP